MEVGKGKKNTNISTHHCWREIFPPCRGYPCRRFITLISCVSSVSSGVKGSPPLPIWSKKMEGKLRQVVQFSQHKNRSGLMRRWKIKNATHFFVLILLFPMIFHIPLEEKGFSFQPAFFSLVNTTLPGGVFWILPFFAPKKKIQSFHGNFPQHKKKTFEKPPRNRTGGGRAP